MPNIGNDSELRQFIDSLSFAQQRALGVRFAQGVIDLTQDPRLTKALETALTPGVSAPEVEEAYKTAKAISTATFTACGRDADWMAQAEHFTAAALQAALAPPPEQSGLHRHEWAAKPFDGNRGRGYPPATPEHAGYFLPVPRRTYTRRLPAHYNPGPA